MSEDGYRLDKTIRACNAKYFGILKNNIAFDNKIIMPIDIKILNRIQTTQKLNTKYTSLIYLNLNN